MATRSPPLGAKTVVSRRVRLKGGNVAGGGVHGFSVGWVYRFKYRLAAIWRKCKCRRPIYAGKQL